MAGRSVPARDERRIDADVRELGELLTTQAGYTTPGARVKTDELR